MMRRGIVGPRRGPGLIGTAARTAVVAGTATAVAGRVATKQHDKAVQAAQADAWQQEQAMAAQAAAAPPPPPAPAAAPAPAAGGLSEEAIAKLKELAALKEQGILTDEEFAAQKAAILG
ncbi:MAG TPA: SHOCT domain-containing protein [Aquihabitans sp.]|nr:SHOCT domain-containing protein [Aquihabitans sp.]